MTYRPSGRSNRSGRSQAENDVFEGLPVKQWGQSYARVSLAPPLPEATKAIDDKWGEHPMPRDSHLLTPYTQHLLRLARSGKYPIKRKHDPTDTDDSHNPSDDTESTTKLNPEDRGYVIKRWKPVPESQLEPEHKHFEFLAKRRNGLSNLYGNEAQDVANVPTRRTKIRRTNAEGIVFVYEVLAPEGLRLEGEIPADLPPEELAALPASLVLGPGTVIAGLGVANDEGVVVLDQLRPLGVPRRNRPQAKKKGGPGRGKKRVTFTNPDGSTYTTVVPNATKIVPQPGQTFKHVAKGEIATADITSEQAKRLAGERGESQAGGEGEGEGDDDDGDDDDEGDEGDEGDEDDEDDDREDGELTDAETNAETPAATTALVVDHAAAKPTSLQEEVEMGDADTAVTGTHSAETRDTVDEPDATLSVAPIVEPSLDQPPPVAPPEDAVMEDAAGAVQDEIPPPISEDSALASAATEQALAEPASTETQEPSVMTQETVVPVPAAVLAGVPADDATLPDAPAVLETVIETAVPSIEQPGESKRPDTTSSTVEAASISDPIPQAQDPIASEAEAEPQAEAEAEPAATKAPADPATAEASHAPQTTEFLAAAAPLAEVVVTEQSEQAPTQASEPVTSATAITNDVEPTDSKHDDNDTQPAQEE